MGKPRGNLSGMFLVEQRVMDLWDQGFSMERIVQHTGMTSDYVHTIVSRYSGKPDRDFEVMVRLGSLALISAIRKHHPERCGGVA